jgi:hypothetical protein
MVFDGGALWVATRGDGLLQIRERVLDVVLPTEGVSRRVERLAWDAPSQTLWARSEWGAWWSVTDPSQRLDTPAQHATGAPAPIPEMALPFSLDGIGRWWAHRGGIAQEDPRTRALAWVPGPPAFWQPPEAWNAPDGSLRNR